MPLPDLQTFTPNLKQLPKPPALPFTIKANLRAYYAALGVARPIMALILVAIATFYRFWYGITIGVSVAMVLALVWAWMINRRLIVEPERLATRNAFGKTRTIAYQSIDEVHVFAAYVDNFGPAIRIIVASDGGSKFVSLNLLYWSSEDIEQLLAALRDKGVTLTYYNEPLNSMLLAKRAPQLASYAERHPYLLAFYIVMALVVAITIFVAVTS